MKKLEWMNSERKRIADFYLQELSGIPGLAFPRITVGSVHNWHLFGILVPPAEKYWIMDALRAEGVMSNVHYTPLHRNRFYRNLASDNEMPGSMQFFNRLLRLPIYPSLTIGQRKCVTSAVKKVFES
jgi:dTDP-4-amino-4,6-dideoxygalactose transaminase